MGCLYRHKAWVGSDEDLPSSKTAVLFRRCFHGGASRLTRCASGRPWDRPKAPLYQVLRLRYILSVAWIGYVRVSSRDQNPEAQSAALEAAGCEKIFVERAPVVLARRPVLDETLEWCHHGDTLVVTKLDRLARSLRNLRQLMEALHKRGVELCVLDQGIDTARQSGGSFLQIVTAIAEFEHDLIAERTHDGLAAARARGRTGGSKFKMTADKIEQANAMYKSNESTVKEIADAFGVSKTTIYRHLRAESDSDEGLGP